MTREEIAAGIDRLSPWFYRFELPHGLHTTSDLPEHVVPIHETRLRMALEPIRRHFGDRLADIECLDIGSHEGFYSFAMAPLVKHVTGVEPREDSRERARFIKNALELKNVDFRPGVVETLGVDISRAYDLTLFLGVLYHVPDPILCLRNVAQVTGELCIIETQVVEEVEGISEWGAQEWTRNYHGILALIDESGEFHAGNRETGIMPLRDLPLTQGSANNAAPRRLPPSRLHPPAHEGAYEQLARKKRVVVAAWK